MQRIETNKPTPEEMVEAYFQRIGYTGPRTVSAETLKAIHFCHVTTIPFENFDIHLQENANNRYDYINLDLGSIFNKIVLEKRGGYCLEMNEWLAFVLRELGFEVDLLSGRALIVPNLPRGHKMLLVSFDSQQWIADVGFGGDGIFEAIPFKTDEIIAQQGHQFKLVKRGNIYILAMWEKAEWKEVLEFSKEIFKPIDFNYSLSHHPNSFFVKNLFCCIAIPGGRISLLNHQLKIKKQDHEEIITLPADEAGYLAALKDHFGIVFSENAHLKLPQVKSPGDNFVLSQDKKPTWCTYFATGLGAAVVGMGVGVAATAYYLNPKT